MPGICKNTGCEADGTKRCAGCKQVSYCSRTCQKQDWQWHKSACRKSNGSTDKDKMVKVVKIHAKLGGGGRYSGVQITREDPIFKTKPVPISQKFGFPLLVYRPMDKSEREPLTDNQHATWLMIDPITGFAPAEWQSHVGNVLVARADGEALETNTLAAITDYISDILDAFGNGVGAARKYYNKDRLDKYIANHLDMQQQFKRFQPENKSM